MLKLNSKVKIKDVDIEGRVNQVVSYINGSTSYTVQYQDANNKSDIRNITRHEIDLELTDESETIDLPEANVNLALGTHVAVLPYSNFEGIVTGILYSSSGCVEYEVTGIVQARGVVRAILDGEILKVVANATPVAPGDAGGSRSNREVDSR